MGADNKFTPPAARGPLRAISMAVHVAAPPVGLWLTLAALPAGGLGRGLAGLLAAVAYLSYLVFAIVLHKEAYPERTWPALRLAAAPAILAGLSFKFLHASVGGWFGAAGLIYFLGVQFATWILFAGGTHWAPADPHAGAGDSRVRWRRDGRSPWFDPARSLGVRWTTGLFFVLPGALATCEILRAMFFVRPAASCGDALFGVAALLFGAVVAAWLDVRQLVAVTADGRIFGPAKDAFR